VVIDMTNMQTVHSIDATFLQDTRSWIIFPTLVDFYGSIDGEIFEKIGSIKNSVPAKDYETQTKAFGISINTPLYLKAVKVVVHNFGTLPDWHQGKGGEAFIFVDEITVK
jgi:hypothetical protein